jgi:hypothetical protein
VTKLQQNLQDVIIIHVLEACIVGELVHVLLDWNGAHGAMPRRCCSLMSWTAMLFAVLRRVPRWQVQRLKSRRLLMENVTMLVQRAPRHLCRTVLVLLITPKF